jgi:hypothetical protein
MAEPVRLEPGQPVTREITEGERHAYRVAVKANQALHIVASQLGADVVVTLLGMDGKPIVEMDTPTGTQGAESVWFVASTDGDYPVEVRALQPGPGRYELRAIVRDATPDDGKRVEMQGRYLKAFRLGFQGTAADQRAAIGELKEIVALARSAGEGDMAALSTRTLAELDIGAGLDTLALQFLPGKVPVYYSPGYKPRAAKLRDRLLEGVRFFEQRLGVTPKIYLGVLTRESWMVACNPTYGVPMSKGSRSGSALVCLPATQEVLDELGRNTKGRMPEAELKAIESTGVSFEKRVREYLDGIMYHELGHIYSGASGIRAPNNWTNEFLANYLWIAYRSNHPNRQLDQFEKAFNATFVAGPAPEHTSLEDFERLYFRVGLPNYAWYQTQFVRRAAQVYPTKKLGFLDEVRTAFPRDEKRPVPVDVSLERLEKISPGFLDWAKELGGAVR